MWRRKFVTIIMIFEQHKFLINGVSLKDIYLSIIRYIYTLFYFTFMIC